MDAILSGHENFQNLLIVNIESDSVELMFSYDFIHDDANLCSDAILYFHEYLKPFLTSTQTTVDNNFHSQFPHSYLTYSTISLLVHSDNF